MKGASGAAKTRELKYRKSIEPAPTPPLSLRLTPATPDGRDPTGPTPPSTLGTGGGAAAANPDPPPALPGFANTGGEACLEGQEVNLFALSERRAVGSEILHSLQHFRAAGGISLNRMR